MLLGSALYVLQGSPQNCTLHRELLLHDSNKNAASQRVSYSRFARKHIFIFVSTLLLSTSPSISKVAADWQRSQPIILSRCRFFEARICSPQRLKWSTFAATLADSLWNERGERKIWASCWITRKSLADKWECLFAAHSTFRHALCGSYVAPVLKPHQSRSITCLQPNFTAICKTIQCQEMDPVSYCQWSSMTIFYSHLHCGGIKGHQLWTGQLAGLSTLPTLLWTVTHRLKLRLQNQPQELSPCWDPAEVASSLPASPRRAQPLAMLAAGFLGNFCFPGWISLDHRKDYTVQGFHMQ